jgi:hypothetical protein
VSAATLKPFVDALAGGTPRATVVTVILNSRLVQTAEVGSLYQSLLHRPPSPQEISMALGQLQGGGGLLGVEATLLGSDEYYQAHGGTNAGFLQALSWDTLGRDISPAEAVVFEPLLQAGVSRIIVAERYLHSWEFYTREVVGVYQRFFHRAPTPAELGQGVVNVVASGGEVASLEVLVLSSAEYYAGAVG